jgi:vitamin K-dependent gamma-carboxylase
LEKARYLNHFYLICLISFLLIFIPAHRAFSMDAWRRPRLRSKIAPAWALGLLRLQLGIPYFYGGLAKLNGDWLQGEPMRMWMVDRTDFPVIGSLFTREWVVHSLSYGGLLLDLLVVPLLLWRRTRPFAFGAALIFHLMNARLFAIGIFPWFMIAATLVFFRPDWPRLLWQQRLGLQGPRRRSFSRPTDSERMAFPKCQRPVRSGSLSSRQFLILGLLSTYTALQLLLPLRHYFYPGNVSWTEEGHRFAWHMKLRSKSADAVFVVFNKADNRVRIIKPEAFLPSWQSRKMATRPDMILQFSHFLAQSLGPDPLDQVEVRAEVFASLNGRGYQRLVDPTVDLAQVPQTLMPMDWILPLQVPLSNPSGS